MDQVSLASEGPPPIGGIAVTSVRSRAPYDTWLRMPRSWTRSRCRGSTPVRISARQLKSAQRSGAAWPSMRYRDFLSRCNDRSSGKANSIQYHLPKVECGLSRSFNLGGDSCPSLCMTYRFLFSHSV